MERHNSVGDIKNFQMTGYEAYGEHYKCQRIYVNFSEFYHSMYLFKIWSILFYEKLKEKEPPERFGIAVIFSDTAFEMFIKPYLLFALLGLSVK